ncbi:aminotransferase class I/II-fold pyridoxal phosphate-dependent enzyme [Pseudomonas sp. RP23018S]|uniref:pyoverdine biosynthesis transaminase PtaA n=1 Tax=Pseudomonas sp. RP23018S TaxID=3096037 RepID=UPI002ACA143B|nr:aminotransferase class I/II-fold pyridoxal phosphate-dependent enzyme [Pseudomonas sp. RP23018S]MDZ5605058.1 aminotransferase class I/II-fold pyridoxal phosphate-dependent enzyme [Pseudomonas sp. RP23018S]
MEGLSRRRLVGLTAALPLLGQVSWAAPAAATETLSAAQSPVRLNFNESPWGPSASARTAMHEGVASCGRYPYPLQYALIETFARQQGVAEDHVQLFCGSKLALQYAVHAFTGARSLVVPEPSYEAPVDTALTRQTPVHAVALDAQHAHDVDAMLAIRPAPGMIYVCNPNNPTGTVTPAAALERLIAKAPSDTVVVVDEAYIHFSDAPSCIPLIKAHPNLLVLRTFSKLYGMAGARVGLAIGQPALLEALEAFDGYNVAAEPSLRGALASLEESGLVAQRKRDNLRLREATVSRLSAAGWRCTASQANCFMVDVRQPAQAVVKALADAQVKVGRVWSSWPTWIRVSVGDAAQMQRFEAAFFQVLGQAA